MNTIDKAQWHHEGAKLIIDYCTMLASSIGVNLKNVYWASEPSETMDKHLLTIEAESGEIRLLFASHDIATFPTKASYSERTQKKLKKALFGFRT